MRVKIIIAFILIITLYMVLPIGVDYEKVTEVTIAKSFQFDILSPEEFEEEVIASNINTEGILFPTIYVSRQGEEMSGRLRLMNGDYYGGGEDHFAIDARPEDSTTIFKHCPNSDACSDTLIVAPIDGTVKSVKKTSYNYYSTDAHKYDNTYYTNVKIKPATGSEWSGYIFTMGHLRDIDTALEPGTEVHKGQVLGIMCSQGGKSTATHIHMDLYPQSITGYVRENRLHVGEYIDSIYLDSRFTSAYYRNGMNNNLFGITQEQFDALNSRERVQVPAIIPSTIPN